MHQQKRLRILTWHIHGNYLYYLSQVPHTFIVPVDTHRTPGYAGLAGPHAWGSNMIEVPVAQIAETEFDCILFQSARCYEEDQYRLLTPAQRQLPRIYLEHNPSMQDADGMRHPVDDPEILLVHVTHFNALMWDNGRTPVRVIEHGVQLPVGVAYSGALTRGVALVDNFAHSAMDRCNDVFDAVRKEVPLDLAGLDSSLCGMGTAPSPEFLSPYRFYFHPARVGSLGLAVIEAMMIGMPVVGPASTELATLIRDGENGRIASDKQQLMAAMHALIASPDEAASLGAAARREALERFSIGRFVQDWMQAFRDVAM